MLELRGEKILDLRELSDGDAAVLVAIKPTHRLFHLPERERQAKPPHELLKFFRVHEA